MHAQVGDCRVLAEKRTELVYGGNVATGAVHKPIDPNLTRFLKGENNEKMMTTEEVEKEEEEGTSIMKCDNLVTNSHTNPKKIKTKKRKVISQTNKLKREPLSTYP